MWTNLVKVWNWIRQPAVVLVIGALLALSCKWWKQPDSMTWPDFILAVWGILTGGTVVQAFHVGAKALKKLGPPLIAVAVCLFMTGCGSTALVHSQITAATGVVQTADLGITSPQPFVSLNAAKNISRDAHILDASFHAAVASLQGGGTPLAVTISQITAGLAALEADLAGTPAGAAAKAKLAEARAKMTSATAHGAKDLSAFQVIQLIQLVMQFIPGIATEIEVITGQVTVTPDDCAQALVAFDAALAKLDASIAAKGG